MIYHPSGLPPCSGKGAVKVEHTPDVPHPYCLVADHWPDPDTSQCLFGQPCNF